MQKHYRSLTQWLIKGCLGSSAGRTNLIIRGKHILTTVKSVNDSLLGCDMGSIPT